MQNRMSKRNAEKYCPDHQVTPFNVIYSLVEHVVAVPIIRLFARVDNYGFVKKTILSRLNPILGGKNGKSKRST